MYALILQRLLAEAIFDVIYFPVWWYAGGAKHALFWCLEFFKTGNQTLAPGLWLKNIFVPMYGQYDFQGRLISFFMRSANVFGRSLVLLIWLTLAVIIFLAYLLLPGLVIYGLIYSWRHSPYVI